MIIIVINLPLRKHYMLYCLKSLCAGALFFEKPQRKPLKHELAHSERIIYTVVSMGKRNIYGSTAWGKWFLEMLAAYDSAGRLARGKTYANTGKVQSLAINGRTAAAKVEGRYSPWYHVYFNFPPLAKTTEKSIAAVLAKNPAALAGLRSGFMDERLIEELKRKKIRLIPARWHSIEKECSCPDSASPCKHMAAVLFILAKEIDHDPRLLFSLAGFDLFSAHSENEGVPIKQEQPVPLYLKKEKNAPSCTPKKALHFQVGESYLPLITNILPENPSFADSGFIVKLTEFYHKAAVYYSIHFYDSKTHENKEDGENISPFLFSEIAICTDQLKNENGAFPLSNGKYLMLTIRAVGIKPIQLSLLQAFKFFDNKNRFENISSDCKTLFSFYSLAGKLIQASAFVPAVLTENKSAAVFWKPLLLSAEIREDIKNFSELITETFFPPVKEWGAFYCANILLTAFLTEFVHSMNFIPLRAHTGITETDKLFFSGNTINIKEPGKRNLGTVIYSWLSVLNYIGGKYEYRLTLKQTGDTEVFSLSAFVRTLPTAQPAEAGSGESGTADSSFVELRKAAKSFENPDEVLQLPAVLSPYLPAFSNLSAKKEIFLSLDQAGNFLQTTAKLLRRFGIGIVLPKDLRNALVPKPIIKIENIKGAGNIVSFFNMDDILNYDRAVMLGDSVLSYEEFQKLFSNKSGLVKFNDRFLLLDAEEIAKILSAAKKPATAAEALQAMFSGNAVCSKPVKKMIDSVFKGAEVAEPKNLRAKLRPYQVQGFKWLYANIKSGFGCLLADDMGLGKTVQIIAFILSCKNFGELDGPILIIAPASLLSNWEHEIGKFATELGVCMYHGYGRKFEKTADVIITTYQTIQKDIEKIKTKKIFCAVLDEAQAIKNAAAKKTKAVKMLKAQRRIALTGTPVENNLEDMRSIFDFILPDYLGSAEEFKAKWRIPIELHGLEETAEQLKKITAPFLLRRLKTDPAIISDLPEKIVTNQYCNLTADQLALYESLVQTELDKVMGAETKPERQERVLKLLTLLKQVCNHPGAYDKVTPADSKYSGKTSVLTALLKDILAQGEKVIVFSQYVGTLDILKYIAEKELQTQPLMLHGKMPVIKRKEAVDLFQSDPAYRIFLISLKAGGTGLNLTAANRVIHFDLWYNPAVEDQATDRVFRIGQKKNVFIHRFICAGTFEEKIDAMIQKKREISGMTVSSGETWISKLSDEELRSLFTR